MVTHSKIDFLPSFRCQINIAIKWLEQQLRNPKEYNDQVNLIFLDREEPPTEEQINAFCQYLRDKLFKDAKDIITVREIYDADLKLALINTPFPLDTLADALKIANITQSIHRFPLKMRIEITPYETVINLRITSFCIV